MKKYIVKFGCFDLGLMEPENIRKYIKQKKEDILAVLKKDPSITSIEPLEHDLEIRSLFSIHYFGEPIKFKIKLPFKNQELSQNRFYYNKKIYEVVEEFNVLLSENLFVIYQEVDPTKFDFVGGPDVREKIYNMIKEIFPKLKLVPPTPFRQNFIFLLSYPDDIIAKEKEIHEKDFVFDLEEIDFEKNIYIYFCHLEFYLNNIYKVYDIHHKINDFADKIITTQEHLNLLYKNFINSNFFDNLKNGNKKSIKILTMNLFELMLEYVSAVNQYEKSLSLTIFFLNKTPFEDYTIQLKNETDQYIKIDVDVLHKYIESITNDINTRSVNFSTIAAGIIGGVIGGVGTIIVTIINKP